MITFIIGSHQAYGYPNGPALLMNIVTELNKRFKSRSELTCEVIIDLSNDDVYYWSECKQQLTDLFDNEIIPFVRGLLPK